MILEYKEICDLLDNEIKEYRNWIQNSSDLMLSQV